MAPHSSTLAWKIPWTEKPGGLVVHGVARSRTRLSDFTFTFHFHALEKAMAAHSSVLAWRIPGTGEPGGLPSMALHRVGHDWSDLAVLFWIKSTHMCVSVQCKLPPRGRTPHQHRASFTLSLSQHAPHPPLPSNSLQILFSPRNNSGGSTSYLRSIVCMYVLCLAAVLWDNVCEMYSRS